MTISLAHDHGCHDRADRGDRRGELFTFTDAVADGSGGQAAHEKWEVEKPASPSCWIPKASIFDRVAWAIVSSDPAG